MQRLVFNDYNCFLCVSCYHQAYFACFSFNNQKHVLFPRYIPTEDVNRLYNTLTVRMRHFFMHQAMVQQQMHIGHWHSQLNPIQLNAVLQANYTRILHFVPIIITLSWARALLFLFSFAQQFQSFFFPRVMFTVAVEALFLIVTCKSLRKYSI